MNTDRGQTGTCRICEAPNIPPGSLLCAVCHAWEDELGPGDAPTATAFHRALARFDYFGVRHQVQRVDS